MSIVRLLAGPHISEEAPSSSGRKSADKCTQASMAMGYAAQKQPGMSQQACIDLMYDMADHMQTLGDFKPGSGSTFEGAHKELEYRGVAIREYFPFTGGPLDINKVHEIFQANAGAYPLIVQYLQAHMLIDTAGVHRDTNVQCHAIYHPAKATEGYPTADPNNPTVMQTLDTYPWDYVGADGNHYGISQAQPCAIIVLDAPVTQGTPDGWTDNGTTLTAPNGVAIIGAMRGFVLAHTWHPDNLPLGLEYETQDVGGDGTHGAGTEQLFQGNGGYGGLGYTDKEGAFPLWTGTMIALLRKQVAEAQQAALDKTTLAGIASDLQDALDKVSAIAK